MKIEIEDKSRFIEAMKAKLIVDPKTTAVLAVDMHQGHLDPDFGPMLVQEEERQRVLANSKKLVEIVRKYKIPIIHALFHLRPVERLRGISPFTDFAQEVNTKLEPEDRSWIGNDVLPEGWYRPEIMPEVAPGPDDFVIDNKKTYSPYLGTDLEHLLHILGVDTVVVIGINTNTCDLCSSFETVNRGLKLIVISDCTASAYGRDLHAFALQNIARCLGWVLTIPEFEEKLEAARR